MSGEKLFTETTSGGCTDGETRRTYQREQKYDGETGNIWDPTWLCIHMLIFEEHAVEDRQGRVSSAKKLVTRTGLGSRTLPRYPSRTVRLNKLICGRYFFFAAREQGIVLPPAFSAIIAAAINARVPAWKTISATVRNFSTRLLHEQWRVSYLAQWILSVFPRERPW